jgi:hypothetical protein
MRQVKPEGPRIYGDKLYRDGADPLPVGGPGWYAWLAEASTFYWRPVREGAEWYRARRELRRAGAYWYVACRVGGQVRRFYLGPPAAIDGAHLAAVAEAIADARASARAARSPLGARPRATGHRAVPLRRGRG